MAPVLPYAYVALNLLAAVGLAWGWFCADRRARVAEADARTWHTIAHRLAARVRGRPAAAPDTRTRVAPMYHGPRGLDD